MNVNIHTCQIKVLYFLCYLFATEAKQHKLNEMMMMMEIKIKTAKILHGCHSNKCHHKLLRL